MTAFYQRRIQFFHLLFCPVLVCANHHPVRLHKIVNRRTFFQKFRVRNNGESEGFPSLLYFISYNIADFVRCANRHRGFTNHNYVIPVQFIADCFSDCVNIFQIGVAVIFRRRANRYKNNFTEINGFI